ncbi:mitochondrial substrate carrier family protein ucpB-like [Diadema setosum]|uniref:mitochondrial substrate carrier family protein ucpB-like n=1 Tax=Diadema setosum TaxID=31175 RepID=UPI003B3B05E2
MPDSGRGQSALRYSAAGVANMCASFVTNPVEVTKVRIQLEGELESKKALSALRQRYYKGLLHGLVTIAKDEGVRGLYKGLTPSLIRDGIYSALRVGGYEPLKRLYGATDPARTPLHLKLAAGATSGGLSSWITTPTDIIRIRIQGEGVLAPGQAPRYRGFLHAFSQIAKTEGVLGLYRGTVPTVQRAMILTAAQIPTYDHTKHTILNHGWMAEGMKLHLVSSMASGFMTAFTTSPVDVIKTRVMNQKIRVVQSTHGTLKHECLYRGSLDCLLKTLRAEGLYGLYKGFFSNWLRLGPHTTVSFIVFEKLRELAGIEPI